ncbi:hypothetical protein [Mesonia sp. K4-1]|uniref:hypothetical protein n=1 Tax=Mesonia sp. K4-1 TaxID=2602760 RepID=UPI0011C77149|nr:hypothetical protein [Mesonia sp. K4-1]TXK74883.1 hypothetical protein FT986_10270 [Mesonia sp. K4-1]
MERKLFKISLISFFITYVIPLWLAVLVSPQTARDLRGPWPEYANPIYYNIIIQIAVLFFYIFSKKVKDKGNLWLYFWFITNIIIAGFSIWFAYELSLNTKGSLLNNNI